jgi:hypothetical protein
MKPGNVFGRAGLLLSVGCVSPCVSQRVSCAAGSCTDAGCEQA